MNEKKLMFCMNRKFSGLLLCMLAFQWLTAQSLPAFPGAEGAGKFTSGGRGTSATPTTVFEVTNVNDDNNPGSLRYALSQTAAYRTVVFRISGTIHLNSKLSIRANTTIAGQTAPGDGICLADYPVVISGDHVIVRYLRFRMGDKNQNGGMVDGSGGDDAFGNLGNKNIIVDHCTSGWSSDEALTIYRGDSVTIQWCIVSEPLNYSYHFEAGDADFEQHAYGGIWGARNGSFHHNLIAHCKGRCPRFAGSSTYPPGTAGQENADFRNNLVYNWGSYSTNGGEGGNYNLVNNYYKYGPSTSTGSSSGIAIRSEIMNPSKSASLPYPKLFIDGNNVDGYASVTQDNWKGIAMSGGTQADTILSKVTSPFPAIAVPMQSATEAYELVLNHAGVSLPNRDTLDARIVNDVRNRTGRLIDVQGGYPHGTAYAQTVNAWPALNATAAPADTDHDGMPDSWETANGLNPNNAADRNGIAFNGYTNLENYLNSIASNALITKGTLNAFAQVLGNPSASQSFSFEGRNLTGDVTLRPSAGYEVSVNGSNWFSNTNPLVLAATGGGINPQTLFVRLNANAVGNYSGTLQLASSVGGIVQLPLAGTVSTVTAIGDVSFATSFSLYPNPASNFIGIRHPASKGLKFCIYDMEGALVKKQSAAEGSTSTIVSIEKLPAGKYLVECKRGNQKASLLFVKIN